MSLEKLLPPVRRALEDAGLFHPGARLLCAVSGGADSVALLHALCELRAAGGFSLEASHVQHGLRGESSVEDERFVRNLCRGLGTPLHVRNAGLSGSMDSPGAETRARDRRRSIFLEQMEALSMDALLLGHHLDDQAETVLMRLARGAGADGLRGMRPAAPFGRGVMLRPFLGTDKEAILEALASEGLPHREDGSNQLPLTPRNALRLEVMPALERLFPGAAEHIAAAAEALETDARFLEAEAERLYEAAWLKLPPLHALRRAPLMRAPEALARRALRRWFLEGTALAGLMPHERALSHGDTLALVSLARGEAGCAHNLPCGLKAVAGRRLLYLLTQSEAPLRPAPSAPPAPVTRKQTAYAADFTAIRQLPAGPGTPVPTHAGEAVLSPEILGCSPVLRRPLPGDWLFPLGAPGRKPLRRFLTDRGVDAPLRPYLTVLADGKEILWIPFLCASERLRLSAVPEGSVRLRAASGAFDDEQK